MNTKDITFVTGVIDIGRDGLDASFKRPFDYYLAHFRKLLNLDYPMVVYGDERVDELVRARTHRPTMFKQFASTDIRQTPYFHDLNAVRVRNHATATQAWLRKSPQYSLELYNPLIMQKMFWVRDASIANPFGTRYVMWIDGGIAGMFKNFSASLFNDKFEKSLAEKMIGSRMFFVSVPLGEGETDVHGFSKATLDDMSGAPTRWLARGTLFGGDRAAVEAVLPVYEETLRRSLSIGELGTEESIFTILVHKYADLFSLAHTKSGNVSEFVLSHHTMQRFRFNFRLKRTAFKKMTTKYRRALLRSLGLRKATLSP